MHRNRFVWLSVIAAAVGAVSPAFATGQGAPAGSAAAVSVVLTNADRSQLLAPQSSLPLTPGDGSPADITIDETQRFQTVDGFGFAMTGGSAQLIHAMTPQARHALLEELFGQGSGHASVSYLRISIGSSDMNDHVFTYDDLPAGQTDPKLKRFTLAKDEKDLIPVLKEVLSIAPRLPILASPWSAPSWMKTNGLPKAGKLRPELYPVYAAYLVRYLQSMRKAGVPVGAITMQNEPLNPKNTPSMVMEAPDGQAFLRDALGPALAKAHLHTKVVLFDHNCNHPDYPLAVLADPKAAAFADGSGFHLYEGEIGALSEVHNAFPAKNLYFTEQMVIERGVLSRGKANGESGLEPVADPVSRIVIGAMRNWSRNVLLWNLAADASYGPHTNDGGCPVCQGAITIEGDKVTRNIAYDTVAQVAPFVLPGSVRVASSGGDATLTHVAFVRPDGRHVLLVANTGETRRELKVMTGQQLFKPTLEAGSVATYIW